jgi:hypothetical protein
LGPATLIVLARDLLGGDGRHLLLVYLLAHPNGAKLRDIQRWSGFSYRSTSETATRWQSARAVSIEHGFCRLNDYRPWWSLLKQKPERIILIDFFNLFEACVALLRSLAKVRRLKLNLSNGAVAGALYREAHASISSASLSQPPDGAPSVHYLLELFLDENGDLRAGIES